MNGRTWVNLQIGLGSGLERECHGSQESQPTPKRSMAERGSMAESRRLGVIGLLSLKRRSTIGVGDSLSQRLVLIQHLVAVSGDLEGCVTFMRQDESRGSQSKRIGIECI
jgi:hypothetical protein